MAKKLRTLTLLLAVSLALSACGLINRLVPDHEVADGVMGIGAAGMPVTLSGSPLPSDLASPNAPGDTTTFVAEFDVPEEVIDAVSGLPGFVQASGIEETITLDDEVQVVFAGEFADAADLHPDHLTFTLTALHVSGHLTIDDNQFNLPPVSRAGLNVTFSDPTAFSYDADANATTVSYATASSLPELDVDFGDNAQLLQAFSDLVKEGGSLTAHLRIEATLSTPGLPASADIVVNLRSLGATISF